MKDCWCYIINGNLACWSPFRYVCMWLELKYKELINTLIIIFPESKCLFLKPNTKSSSCSLEYVTQFKTIILDIIVLSTYKNCLNTMLYALPLS